jgi:mRNA interferase MazF
VSTYRRGDVVRVTMTRAAGHEVRKDRPWVVLSPDSMNDSQIGMILAPLTRGTHPYPSRIPCAFNGVENHIVLDQIRTATIGRVRKKVGAVSPQALKAALATLREMFEE